MLALSDVIGTLRPGMEADVTVLRQKPGRHILRDNEKTEVVADSLLQPVFCLRAGIRHDAVAPILPQAVAA
jgi:dihydroorotase